MYQYKIYGIHIVSEIELPKLQEYVEARDSMNMIDTETVFITMEAFPKEQKEIMQKENVQYIINYNKAYLFYPDEACFVVSDGYNIKVECEPKCNQETVRALLLSNCLGILLYQKDITTIHGGTVVYNKKAITITGVSGSGKSTLCNELRRRGYKLLTDDTVVISDKEDKPTIFPGYPYTKLCGDAAKDMSYDIEKLEKIDEGRDKYIVDISNEFYDTPVAFSCLAIVEEAADHQEVSIKEVHGSEKLRCLLDSLYTYRLFKTVGMSRELMMKHLSLANRVKIYRIKRPKGIMTVKEQADRLLEMEF